MIIGFAEAFNRLKEKKGKADPANYDIYKIKEEESGGYVIVEKGIPYVDGYVGTFLPTELDKFFEGEWQSQVQDIGTAAYERFGYSKNEVNTLITNGITIHEIYKIESKKVCLKKKIKAYNEPYITDKEREIEFDWVNENTGKSGTRVLPRYGVWEYGKKGKDKYEVTETSNDLQYLIDKYKVNPDDVFVVRPGEMIRVKDLPKTEGADDIKKFVIELNYGLSQLTDDSAKILNEIEEMKHDYVDDTEVNFDEEEEYRFIVTGTKAKEFAEKVVNKLKKIPKIVIWVNDKIEYSSFTRGGAAMNNETKKVKDIIAKYDKLLERKDLSEDKRKVLSDKKFEMEETLKGLQKLKGSILTETVNVEEAIDRTFKVAEEVLDDQLDDFNPELDEDVEFVSKLVKKLIQKFEEKYVIKGSKIKAEDREEIFGEISRGIEQILQNFGIKNLSEIMGQIDSFLTAYEFVKGKTKRSKVKANYAETKKELEEDIIDEAKSIKEENPNIRYRDLALRLMDISEFGDFLEDVIGNEFDVEQWVEDKLELEEE